MNTNLVFILRLHYPAQIMEEQEDKRQIGVDWLWTSVHTLPNSNIRQTENLRILQEVVKGLKSIWI